jgi:hypothetical protein
MADPFQTFEPGLSDVASRHFAITPSDDADLPIRPRALICKVAGNVVIRDELGVDETYPVVVGQILPFRAVRILETDTTATVVGWI